MHDRLCKACTHTLLSQHHIGVVTGCPLHCCHITLSKGMTDPQPYLLCLRRVGRKQTQQEAFSCVF